MDKLDFGIQNDNCLCIEQPDVYVLTVVGVSPNLCIFAVSYLGDEV